MDRYAFYIPEGQTSAVIITEGLPGYMSLGTPGESVHFGRTHEEAVATAAGCNAALGHTEEDVRSIISSVTALGPLPEASRDATSSVTDYALENDLDPADMMAVIVTDPEPAADHGSDPLGRSIRLSGGIYEDVIYPVNYLDMIGRSMRGQL